MYFNVPDDEEVGLLPKQRGNRERRVSSERSVGGTIGRDGSQVSRRSLYEVALQL